MDLIDILVASVATVFTIIATYLAWRQLRRPHATEIIEIGDKICLYLSRQKSVAAFAEMLRRAPAGAAVFGQCRSCTDYPESFYRAILEAAGRGVSFRFIVSPGPDGQDFASRVRGISTVTLKTKNILHSRVFGTEGSEAIYIVSAPDGYVGVHVRDPVAARHQQAAFEAEWGSP